MATMALHDSENYNLNPWILILENYSFGPYSLLNYISGPYVNPKTKQTPDPLIPSKSKFHS